jgi:16S rRNA (uracil1498-N3)-methyltransferase
VVLQKATELGVSEIVPLWSDYTTLSPKQITPQRLERWQRILKEAALQCEALSWPVLRAPQPLKTAMQDAASSPQALHLVLQERADHVPGLLNALHSASASTQTPQHVGVWVGPEGGWAPHEQGAFHTHSCMQLVSLGTRILRAETASISGLGMTIHYMESIIEGASGA